jgi:hypothetical protein
MSYANHKWAESRILGGVKDGDGAITRDDYLSIGKSNPLVLVLDKELIAHRPIVSFIFAPFGADLASDVRRQ